MRATGKLLPFDGDAYTVFAFIETAVLVNETQGSERLSYTQRAMVNPMMVWEATRDHLVAIEDSAMARYAADSSPSATGPKQRATASHKLAYHRDLREALLKISETLEDFITVTIQPARV